MINIIGGVIVGCILALVGKQFMDESNDEIEHRKVVKKYGKFIRAKHKNRKSFGSIL
tara:strand:+ start:154 stop:324 length:171 start_codon:yes stop_codon:yes gene_type:complete